MSQFLLTKDILSLHGGVDMSEREENPINSEILFRSLPLNTPGSWLEVSWRTSHTGLPGKIFVDGQKRRWSSPTNLRVSGSRSRERHNTTPVVLSRPPFALYGSSRGTTTFESTTSTVRPEFLIICPGDSAVLKSKPTTVPCSTSVDARVASYV